MQISECGSCGSRDLQQVFWLGYQPPCNEMRDPSDKSPVTTYPLELLQCPKCWLVQLGYHLDKETVFPASYPYTSSTTKVLRDNFSNLASEAFSLLSPSKPGVVVVDIGGNDGNLLSNFPRPDWTTVNITPEDIGVLNKDRVSRVYQDYFGERVAGSVVSNHGQAALITATNVFAHVSDVHPFLDAVDQLLAPDGLFCIEFHYIGDLIRGIQYDTIYHEHVRYYSLTSIQTLLKQHGFEVFRCRHIETHGGSLRVWARRFGKEPIDHSVFQVLYEERFLFCQETWGNFRIRVADSKRDLWRAIEKEPVLYGVGAPSRATVLINYCGLDYPFLRGVYEVEGSHRIGKMVPGTNLTVLSEPDDLTRSSVLVLSHHVWNDLQPILARKNAGTAILPLPTVKTVRLLKGAV